MSKYLWNTVKVQMTQISWEMIVCAHQTCVALPSLILTSAIYFSTSRMASGIEHRGEKIDYEGRESICCHAKEAFQVAGGRT